MSQETDFVDPRSQIEHTLDEGQVYEDSRTGDERTLVHLSEQVSLLKDSDGNHLLEKREQFEENVGAGRYALTADDGAVSSSKVSKLQQLLDQYEAADGRKAEHKVSAIEEAIELIENNGRPDDNETIPFDTINGIGSKAASSLRANGFSTKGDVRNADRETIESVPYMGSKNTDALLDFVKNE